MATPVPKQKPRSVPFGQVPLQSEAQILAAATVTSDDVRAAKAWVRSLTRAMLVVDVINNKPARYLGAAIYKRFWEARAR